jgi:hypothetical protein
MKRMIQGMLFVAAGVAGMDRVGVLIPKADAAGIELLSEKQGDPGNDSAEIGRLFRLAAHWDEFRDQPGIADSIAESAVQIAEVSHRPELIFLACSQYVETIDPGMNYRRALEHAEMAHEVAGELNRPGLLLRSYRNLVNVYLAGYEYEKALSCSFHALAIAATQDDPEWKALSYLDIGKSLEAKNLKLEAFRNYLNAVTLAVQVRKPAIGAECYSRLSRFYNMNKLYYKAIHYKLLQYDLVRNAIPVDSLALMWIKYDLQVIDINSNGNRLNRKSTEEILGYAVRTRNDRMLDYEISLIRNHLVESENIGALHELYYRRFPGLLQRIATSNPGLFNRLRAIFCEHENKPDSALYFFLRSEELLRADPNKILRSNFYSRFGQFLDRHGKQDQAIGKFEKSFELAREASYIEYMLRASLQLERIYAGKRDFRNAYLLSVRNKFLSDSMNNMSKKDQLLTLELDHETRQRDLAADRDRENTLRRDSIQYMAMIIVMISVFIILLMLGSLKVPEWIIRMLGFLSFIFLFEFIILVADPRIHELTAGEPWKIILIKIFLLAILLPVHHWIEKRVIAFLLDPNLINIARYPLGKTLKERVRRIRRE